jgi:16S rRNA (cytosine1402-N4)-methyltransferase
MEPKEGETFVDFTLGGAGHFSAFLPRLSPTGIAVGLDRDSDAIERAEAMRPQWPEMRIELRQCRFSNAEDALDEMGIEGFHLALFDLGVSAFQVDDPSRGFSFMANGPLSMQMGESRKTAMEIVNGASERELAGILTDFGEERFARRIARSIVQKRQEKPIRTTLELVEAVDRAVPGPAKKNINAIRARVFQSVRIVTNDEMNELQSGLMSAIRYLMVGGRMGVISWHSLEDRTVKRTFKFHAPKGEAQEEWVLLPSTPKPITPTIGEIAANPRVRSAKLRVVTKVPREELQHGR